MAEDRKGVRCAVNLKQPLHGISVNKEQTTIAVACKNDVQLLNLRSSGLSASSSIPMSQSTKSVDSFVLTDVAWSHTNADCVAVSATNGDIAIMDLSSQASSAVWGAGESARAVNRVSWHSTEPHTVASAHQDGLIKLWDCRQKQNATLIKSYQPRADAGRDVQFDPFHENLVAATFENGNLVLWDRRMADQSWLKISAHISSVQTLAWNPCKEWHLATGGRDMNIKVWDLRGGAAESAQVDIRAGLPAAPSHLPLALKPAWQLTTPAVVGRIAWRGIPTHPDQIASVSVTERSDVSLWKLGFNNVPACIVRGQIDNICVGFAWLDTPGVAIEKPLSAKNKTAQRKNNKNRGSMVGSREEYIPPSSSRTNQHVVTISKDGLVEIQDIRNGHFPRQRISRNVTAISPHGHVAFQRSNVLKYDLLGLDANVPTTATTDAEKCWFDPDPFKFGMDFTKSPDNVMAAQETQPGEDTERGGSIQVGLSRISDLQEAHRVCTGDAGGAAEGGAFDPAVIALLAAAYILGESGSNESKAESIRLAVEALEYNNRVALDAGLNGHASILSAVATLITLLNRSPALNRQSVPLSATSFLTSDVSVEDPFRNLALSSLRDLLGELLDAGDCQHFVICFEILRRNDLLVGISEAVKPSVAADLNSPAPSNDINGKKPEPASHVDKQPASVRLLSNTRVREAYLAYIDVLSRLGLFTAANDLIKASVDPYISELSKKGIRLKVGCAKCGKEVSADQVSGGSQGVTAITSIFCGKCHRSAGRCVLCHKPVLGLFRWCPICSHGGHKECVEQWLDCQVESARRGPSASKGTRMWRRKTLLCQSSDSASTHKKAGHHSNANYISCPSGCGHHCFSAPTERSINVLP